jgi:intracellular multiplication protein IcmD
MKTSTISQQPRRFWLSVLTAIASTTALLLFTEVALAAEGGGVGAIAKTVTTNLASVANLIGAAAYVSGIAFALTGLMKFKAHKDQPQQVPLSQPIVLIMIAAGLIFLPSMITAAGGTLFEGGKAGSAKGEGFEELK